VKWEAAGKKNGTKISSGSLELSEIHEETEYAHNPFTPLTIKKLNIDF